MRTHQSRRVSSDLPRMFCCGLAVVTVDLLPADVLASAVRGGAGRLCRPRGWAGERSGLSDKSTLLGKNPVPDLGEGDVFGLGSLLISTHPCLTASRQWLRCVWQTRPNASSPYLWLTGRASQGYLQQRPLCPPEGTMPIVRGLTAILLPVCSAIR